jgi:hypothetical protein
MSDALERIQRSGTSSQWSVLTWKETLKHTLLGLGVVVHTCNLSYSGDRTIMIWGWPGQKHETLSEKKKKTTNKPKKHKDLGCGACLANIRPWVQSPVPPKTKKQTNKKTQTFLHIFFKHLLFRGMAQVVEHLPDKLKALSSKPQYQKKKKKGSNIWTPLHS